MYSLYGLVLSMFLIAPSNSRNANEPKDANAWFQRAADQMNLRANGSAPFHMKVSFHAYAGVATDKKAPIITGDGSYEETWLAPHNWRREVTLADYHAVEVQSGGTRKMQASSDYEPSRVLMLLEALYNPVPRTYLDPTLQDFPFAWKIEHQSASGIDFVRMSRREYGPSEKYFGWLAATYSFLANGLLFQSDEYGLVTGWQDQTAFAGKAVPRHFSVAAVSKKLLEAEVSIEAPTKTDEAIFDLPVPQAEPGMTLRPIQFEETRGLQNLDGGFGGITRNPNSSRAVLREVIDRHGKVRELEFIDIQNAASAEFLAASAEFLFENFDRMHWRPARQDESPCEVIVRNRLAG